MSLLELMQEIKESGFDPRKDSASGNSRIPVGEYPVVITALDLTSQIAVGNMFKFNAKF